MINIYRITNEAFFIYKIFNHWDCFTAEIQNRFLENWINKLNDVY